MTTECPHRRRVSRGPAMVCVDCGDHQPAGGPAAASPPAAGLATVPAATAAIAVAILWLGGWAAWVFAPFGTLCHEVGHATAGWLFCHPSIPSFDFREGGGVTHDQGRSAVLVVLWTGLALSLLWMHRDQRRTLAWAGGAFLLWGLILFTGADEALCVMGGHLGESAFGAVFLVRATSGRWVAHAGERWLSGVVGWILCLKPVLLCWSILHDDAIRARYLDGKSYCDNDLVRLAGEHWGIGLDATCWLWLIAALAPPLLALALGIRHRVR